ncbi:hypothetical protein HY008_01360, partial [Candidatus Woesebacteria bacterium]|nr:hypothetical protein [Candidatus Woesebacteria bacterium]
MPKLKKFLLIIISLAGFFLFKAPTSTKAQQPDINCIGQSVANYMNTVIAGTRNLSNIRLLSPAFNMTSPYFHPIINAMAANGANFSGLNAIAGNSYNTTGNTITGYTAQAMSNSNIAGMPVFLTEIGMYEITQGTPKATALQNLQNEIAKIKNNNPVFFVAANLFNSFGTNRDPQFQYNVMSDTEIATVCGGPCGKIGINFATYYGTASQGDYQRAANLGMTYTLEIAQNNPQSIIQIINSLPSGIIPVIRIGVGTDSGGFTDPNVYVQFLQTVNAGVSRPFYAIAGPNEPESEPWASQNCTPGPPPPGGTTPPPQITPYIPVRYDCNETNSPEFHSLRPYPASMCDQRLLQVSSYCGNDILIKENFEVRPSNINTQGYDSVQCTGTPEIGQQCTVTTTTSTNFSIDFRDAELPIMGNTQLVPNPYNRGNPWPENLTYEKRVNNYISWYINGTIYRAEEPPLDIQNSTSDLNKLINFSGPINKLLPEKVARWYRKYRYLGASVGGDYHNQTVACTKNNRIVPCDGSSGLTEERLSGVQGAIPMEENYPTYQDFQNAYSAWSSSLDRILSYYIPMKTTEDRPGMATVSGLFTEPVSLFEYPGGENPVDSAEVVSRNISINHDFL